MEFARFLTVSLIGVVVDIALSWTLTAQFGLPLWLAAALGFTVAAGLNFVLHGRWTFRNSGYQSSLARLFRYLLALGLTLAVRLGCVVLLQGWTLVQARPLVILTLSVGMSFCVNYLASKFLVFQRPRRRSPSQ
ncbi:MAG: GtrA family protein [bacterium]